MCRLRPLICAAKRIREHLAGQRLRRIALDGCAKGAGERERPTVELLQFPGHCESAASRKTLIVLGPNFSGGMDSIGEHVGEVLGPEIADLCLVSSTTTESSNPRAEKAYEHLAYVPLAVDDGTKLLRLADLAEVFGFFDPDETRSSGITWQSQSRSRISHRGVDVRLRRLQPVDPDESRETRAHQQVLP